jgi:hypothetical protein
MKAKHIFHHHRAETGVNMVTIQEPTQFGHSIICRLYALDFQSEKDMIDKAEKICNALNNTKK